MRNFIPAPCIGGRRIDFNIYARVTIIDREADHSIVRGLAGIITEGANVICPEDGSAWESTEFHSCGIPHIVNASILSCVKKHETIAAMKETRTDGQ